MEDKDLMIGDWIYDVYRKTAVRMGAHMFDPPYKFSDQFKPIPLTEDILKANGFKEIRKYEWDDGIMVSDWRYKSDDLEQWFNIKYAPTYDGFTWKAVEVNNVHKLQHALRLCGLNDLADNFKIN